MIRFISTLACFACLLFSGCSSSEVVFEKGAPGTLGDPNAGRITSTTPHLIHVDPIERVATVRNGESFEGFLITSDAEGTQSGVLKALPLRTPSSLRTADILEGKPRINDRVRKASASEASDLAKIYRDAGTEIE